MVSTIISSACSLSHSHQLEHPPFTAAPQPLPVSIHSSIPTPPGFYSHPPFTHHSHHPHHDTPTPPIPIYLRTAVSRRCLSPVSKATKATYVDLYDLNCLPEIPHFIHSSTGFYSHPHTHHNFHTSVTSFSSSSPSAAASSSTTSSSSITAAL